jgi:hypothetical protein
MLGIRRRVVGRLRRFNRWWIDRLSPAPASAPAPVPAPAPDRPPRDVRVTSEDTPNPDARKFVASVRIVPSGSISFSNRKAAADHPIGRALFEVAGVRSLFATGDFLTVTREPGVEWSALAPAVEARLRQILETDG